MPTPANAVVDPDRACSVYPWRMPGVVSLVDGAVGELVNTLWERLPRELGIAPPPPGAIPHVSYHVADDYSHGAFAAMQDVAARFGEFEVDVSGLGIFSGDPLVLYLAVIRSPRLSALQKELYVGLRSFAVGTGPYWHANRWAPHITIAMEGLTVEQAGEAVALLGKMNLSLPARIDNLSFLDERSGTHTLVNRASLTGAKVEGK